MNLKHIHILAVAILTLGVASCQKETQPAEPAEVKITLQEIPGYNSPWKNGTKISAFNRQGERKDFAISGLSGKNLQGILSEADPEATYTAAFPASSSYKISNQVVQAAVPLTQDAVENSYDKKALLAFARGTGGLNFNYPVALVTFSIDPELKDLESISLSADQPLAGPASFTVTSSAISVGKRTATEPLTMTGVEKGKSYTFVILTGSYSDIKVTFNYKDKTSDTGACGLREFTAASGAVINIGSVSTKHIPIQPAQGQVGGVVKYNDGTPAEGVVVSDGFKVTKTNEWGEYILDVCSDTWYIYVSYPSDAKVTIANGCPEFFKSYNSQTKLYDFTFTRQAKENEFALFAMADPQAHYQKRSPQKKADTDRFHDEAVPEINKQIAAQGIPCYGVTLGDVVYSEGSRNSNPGMSTMRSHFSLVNMPVFQTMGNHDFTYFYGSSNPLKADATSSNINLKAQRSFETNFGPINYSFNRGDVHVVCMKDIYYDSTTDAASYHGGFSDAQFEWLKEDLSYVPKTKMVILCVHIPLYNITGSSYEHVADVLNLIKQYKNATVFSGHTHYYRGVSNAGSTGMFEHVHAAVCGQWWWSKIEGDGCPNGYTVYKINGASIKDSYFIGFGPQMNTRDCQIRMYRGNTKTGGTYAYFQWPHKATTLLINVFSGDSRWKVQVYEDDALSGTASLMNNSKKTFDKVVKGTIYDIPSSSNQDWWAIGYHVGVVGRGTSGTSYYTNMFHMYKYELKSATSKVKVVATDPYGTQYTCTEIQDGSYPSYIAMP